MRQRVQCNLGEGFITVRGTAGSIYASRTSPLRVRTRQEDVVAWDEQSESALLEAAHQESKDIDLMLFGPDGGCCEDDDDDESEEPGPRPKRRRTETAASSSRPRRYTRRVKTEIAGLQSPAGVLF